jgi:hypothetical protein
MSKEALKARIDADFSTRRRFVEAFNVAAECEALDETTLSRQINGRIAISGGFAAAYVFFFALMDYAKK